MNTPACSIIKLILRAILDAIETAERSQRNATRATRRTSRKKQAPATD